MFSSSREGADVVRRHMDVFPLPYIFLKIYSISLRRVREEREEGVPHGDARAQASLYLVNIVSVKACVDGTL